MPLRIRIEHGQDAGKTWRLGSSGTYRFGRSPAASVQVLDMKVSKEHFEIGVPNNGGEASIRDCGSSHGTLLNGQPVAPEAPRPLVPGDEIRVGLTVLRVLSDGPADAEAPVHAAEAGATNGPRASTASGNATTASVRSPAASGRGSPATNGGTPTPVRTLPPDALVGTTLAGYRIIEKVGAGGMGAVYRAEQLSLHREVAIKVLAEKLVSDRAFVDQFVNEARSAGQLNHPNVVQVYDVGEADGRHFFSMEFIHGGTLESKVPRAGGGVPWKDALAWFLDAANALIFAERKGILHRDIKPDNFMVSQDGSAKLCDLGLAKKSESADLLAQGIIGTPHFIAPEAIRRKTDVDRRADLYSLGCTFYRVLSGKNPYPLGSVKEILLAHLNAPVPRASAIVADLPKEIDDVLVKLMQKDPAARYESAHDLWTALDKIRLQFGMESHGLNPRRAKRIAILVSAIGVVAIGVAGWFILQPPKVIQGKDRVIEKVDTAAQEELARVQAQTEFQQIRLDDMKEALEQGDNWKKDVWLRVKPPPGPIVARYRDFAKAHPDSPRAKDAEARAGWIEDYVAGKQKDETQHRAEVQAAEASLSKAVSDVNEKAKAFAEKRQWLEAEALLQGAMDDLDAKVKAILPERAKAEKERFQELQKGLVKDVESAFDAVHTEATARGASGEAGDLAQAKARYDEWLKTYPAEQAEGKKGLVARAWAAAAERARGESERIARLQQKAVDDALRADERMTWEALRRVYGFAGAGGVAGGYLVEYRFDAARDDVKALKPKTPRYRAMLDRWIEDLDRLASLPDRLKPLVGQTVKGGDWQGVVAAVAQDGVRLRDGSEHKLQAEGVQWFFDGLVYGPKGEERVPLSADDHLALAILAAAGGTAESGALFDRAATELQRVRTADATRADAVAARLAALAPEKEARLLFERLQSLQDKTDADIDELSKAVKSPYLATAQEARKTLAAKEKELRAALAEVRAIAQRIPAEFATTRIAAVLQDASAGPPKGAAYAGETPPAEAAPPAPPATPPAPPTPGTPPAPNAPPSTPPAQPVAPGGTETPPAMADSPPQPAPPAPSDSPSGPGGTSTPTGTPTGTPTPAPAMGDGGAKPK